MLFSVAPRIAGCKTLGDFFEGWDIGASDLIVTNEYVLAPGLGGREVPCDVLYQERYGTGEPTDEMVDAMLAAIHDKCKGREKDYERVIAIGGGTVIDVAKLMVYGDGLTCAEIFERGASLPRKRSLIAIPTTCGTGSEVTGISIVGFPGKGTKIGLATAALYPDEAVLIPALLETLPREVFATSSIDALIHATESYVSPKANAFTRALGRSAIEGIAQGYLQMAQSGGEVPHDKTAFLHASTMAGIAFACAGVGAVHALSYPIGANYHLPHGLANYLVFGEVFAAYARLGADLQALEAILSGTLGCSTRSVWDTLEHLLDGVLPRKPLREYGADEAAVAAMAESVVRNQQRLLVNNPVPLAQQEIESIYRRCL